MTPQEQTPKATINQDELAHSGDLGLEQPVIDLDKPLFDAHKDGQVTVPNNVEQGFEAERKIQAERANREAEQNKFLAFLKKPIGKAAVAGAGLGLAAAGVAIANNQSSDTPHEARPSATSAPAPGETQAPVETKPAESPLASPTNLGPLETAKPSTSPEIETRYSVAELKAMSVEQFNELPRNERMVLIHHMLEKAQEVSLYYGEDTYKYNPLEVASEKNTAQEIVKQLQFEAHMIFHQGASEQADDTRLDKVAAQKALSGMLYETSGNTSAYFTMATTTIENAKNTGAVPDRYDNAQEIAPPQTTIDQDGKEVTYRTISFTDQTNMPHTAKVVYTPIGNGKGIWQLYELTRNN